MLSGMLDKVLLCKPYRFLFVSGLSLIWMVLMAKSQKDIRANYRFTTCGSRDREGPTYMECTEHYCNSGSLVCGHLLNEGTRGSQIFVVPRSGNYTVTIAGASGGHGVCSNYSGLGVIANKTVQFRRGEILRILVGQQGTNACDGHQDVDVCQISSDLEACESLWVNEYRSILQQIYLFDGGGGGGGASLLEYNDSWFNGIEPIVIAPGGGGAGAIYNVTIILSSLNITYDDSDDLEALFISYTYGHAFETRSSMVNGTIGIQSYRDSAGPGAGYYPITILPRTSDPDPLALAGFGGKDCSEGFRVIFIESLAFPDTHGGFGGGGGGCNGGGGGGGYTGGSIIVHGAVFPGEGGYSWPDPPWPFVDYNDGDGYVELFLESCGCTHNCTIYDSSFECSCPSDALLALNGFDCYTEENFFLETENNSIILSHPSYGTVMTHIAYLNSTVFSYGIAGAFSDEASSNSCAILFADHRGKLIATTKFINRSSDNDLQSFELFNVTTMVNRSSSSTVMSINLSINSELMLEEPLSVASVITFGIGGDCILDELIVNASIDDIYEPEPNQLLDLTSPEVLGAYLDSFVFTPSNVTINNIPITNATNTTDIPNINTGTSDELTPGAIAGIIISVVVVVMAMLTMLLVVSIYFCRHSAKYKISHMEYNEEAEKKVKDLQSYHLAINHQSLHVDIPDHQYEKLSPGYENLPDIELTAIHRRGSTLKYGFKAPLQDYYKFNCARKIDDWSYDRAQLIYMREIGEGQFGKVLLMKAKDICGVQGSVLVAVKTLTSREPKDIQRFSEEMGLMKKFIHPNIVSLLGHCEATSDGAPMMILELMQHGDLKWFLESDRPSEDESSVITDSVAIEIVTDIATALEYLITNKYVHRDVAARNCLIGEGFKAKLSDFGLARGVHEKDYYKITAQTTLPVRWMAPESLLYGKFTSASDVWSYGVLVWEVATYGEPPHEELQVRELINLASNGSLKLNRPTSCPELLADIISQCTVIQSEDRPTFTKILEYYKQKKDASTVIEQSLEI